MTNSRISAAARLDGQVALVTGAAGGIGREVVRTLAAAGATVIATDLDATDAFTEWPGIRFMPYDVTSRPRTDGLVTEICAEFGRIDILVLCAGTIANTPIADASDEEWESIWRVNVMGVVNPVRRIFPLMCGQGGGKIVALGSIAAKIGGVASGPAYVAAKSAVHGIIKWAAKAGAPKGVYANIIAPGPVETPMWQNVTERAPPSAHNSVPLGRFGQPEDIAQAVLFLASPASNWITGTTLDVNGGMLMD
ncbi:SDR family NAD(P)-dependent oxidoreductase [Acidocella sp.]|uniref:SDR family NAD(P)-dependent oxidoreductase n=1 Tax=Acidocella sp. TaxID=50710 RepID=UPI0026112653|nr:SDR family oxidoreductase [Acidocella sp.]